METIIKYLDTSWFYGSDTYESSVHILLLLLSWIPILILGLAITLFVLLVLIMWFGSFWVETEKFLNQFRDEEVKKINEE